MFMRREEMGKHLVLTGYALIFSCMINLNSLRVHSFI